MRSHQASTTTSAAAATAVIIRTGQRSPRALGLKTLNRIGVQNRKTSPSMRNRLATKRARITPSLW